MHIRAYSYKFSNLILLSIAIALAMSGCDSSGCKSDGAYHSCVFFPSDTQLSAMRKGKSELFAIFNGLPSPSSSIQYDYSNELALTNERIIVYGNFEGHSVNLKKTFFSKDDPKKVCEMYLSYFRAKPKLINNETSSCGDRFFSDGKPIYTVSFLHRDSDFMMGNISIGQGLFRTRDSKTWESEIKIDLYYVVHVPKPKDCMDSATYKDYCSRSHWHEKW